MSGGLKVRGTDGRMWNVNAHGTRWRMSDAQDGLPGCYIEDDMRTPAQRARDEANACTHRDPRDDDEDDRRGYP